jgi:MFS family permease
MSGVESTYAWWRLAASVTLSTVGGIGMWCLVVALPSIQQDLGVTRADISFAYTMNTLGFFAGGVTWGKLVDRRGIVLTAVLSATASPWASPWRRWRPALPFFAAVQVLIGFSSSATFAPLVADISHWFDRRRGIAVAIAASGNLSRRRDLADDHPDADPRSRLAGSPTGPPAPCASRRRSRWR